MNQSAPALPHPVSGARLEIQDPEAGRVSYFTDAPEPSSLVNENPLLLIHSINAAASAHEVKPLYDFYRQRRPTYAIDLPGYGYSERSNRRYLPRTMVDALHAVINDIRSENAGRPVDALAVSLSCEFLGRAAIERPATIGSLALVSPTGLRRNTPHSAPPETHRGSRVAYRILTLPLFGKALFRLLTTAPSVRYFLRRTWGRKRIDEEMWKNSVRTTRHPGARYAPFHFLSGYLFSADILDVYAAIEQPLWLSHGVRGDFTDYSKTELFSNRPNWRVQVFETGALPYFEVPEAFVTAYEEFFELVAHGRPVNPAMDPNPA